VSLTSLNRPWPNIELGAGWIRLGGVADALKAEHPANLDFAKFKAQVLAAAVAVRHEGGIRSAPCYFSWAGREFPL
jgi:hypothetical protein